MILRELHRRKMSAWFSVILVLVFLLVGAHRLPAPIQEVPESPTPAPEQSAKPKPKRTVKPKANESSESSTKRQTPSSTPKNQATPNRNPFDGAWLGIFKNIPFYGDVEFTITITGTGTALTSKSSTFGVRTYQSTCDGTSVKWTDGPSHGTLTPNSDGRTAVVASDNGGGFFGIGAYSSSVIFRRVSQ
jgi:hypothetical protein